LVLVLLFCELDDDRDFAVAILRSSCCSCLLVNAKAKRSRACMEEERRSSLMLMSVSETDPPLEILATAYWCSDDDGDDDDGDDPDVESDV